MSDSDPTVDIGEAVYDADGERLGTVRGFDEGGFFVATAEGVEALSVAHAHTPAEFAEAELTWRCSACGETGDIEELPDGCPACGAGREELYYWIED